MGLSEVGLGIVEGAPRRGKLASKKDKDKAKAKKDQELENIKSRVSPKNKLEAVGKKAAGAIS